MKHRTQFGRALLNLPCGTASGFAVAALTIGVLPLAYSRAGAAAATVDDRFFEIRVRPILAANCFQCHGEQRQSSTLRLDTRAGALRGGSRGPAVVPGDEAKSLLLKVIAYQDELKMPPTKKLGAVEIATLTEWVKSGAPWPGARDDDTPPVATPGGKRITDADRAYWAYVPVKHPPLPKVKNAAWVRTPIDAFILAKLEAAGLKPSPTADRVALIRRVTYDLTGLPPTPDQVKQFVDDTSPRAWENLIDRLLASSHYGEKWGRFWLDLVRYAESNGYERDGPKPHAWRFRDYVIRSFNDDRPFDQFIREQLAGDELPWSVDNIVATGYYRLGLWDDEPVDYRLARYDGLDDIVTTTAQVFLATTLNCARCHDHKIDPVTQADYYRFLAFFQDVHHYSDTREVASPFNLTDISPPEVRATYEDELKRQEQRRGELLAALTAIEDAVIKRMPMEEQVAAAANDRAAVLERMFKKFASMEEDAQVTRLRRELGGLNRMRDPGRELALSVNRCDVPPPPTYVLIRGNPHVPGARVEPGFPIVLGFKDRQLPERKRGDRTAGRRTILADWIASPENPLTARVFVNRVWQGHFGRGLVGTANDFGKYGEAPTHPELLDWLANEFMKGGWKVKQLHKLILMSNVYQQSSRANTAGLKADPANTLLWRANMRRLTAEEVRDSILCVSGQLNLKAGGPSIFPKIPREVLHGQSRPGEHWLTSSPTEAARRSVYVCVKRSLLLPILSQHDMADPDNSCPVRYVTVVPTQSLGLLNGDFANEQATAMAERLRREAGADLAAQVRLAIRLTTAREPSPKEVSDDVAFVRDLQSKRQLSEAEALRNYCLLALNANEFVYLD